MSYTPTEWKTGDIVSSQRLNKLEEGVRDAYEVMVINNNDSTLDKTWQEIYDAIGAGKLCVVLQTFEETIRSIGIVVSVSSSGNEYVVNTSSDETFNASSSIGYPAASIG